MSYTTDSEHDSTGHFIRLQVCVVITKRLLCSVTEFQVAIKKKQKTFDCEAGLGYLEPIVYL